MTFLERPAAGQAGDGPSNGGGRDRLPEFFLERLAVLLEGKVVIGLQSLGQPPSKHLALPGRPAGDWPGIGLGSTSPVWRRRLSQRLMVGTDTEKVVAASSLGTPWSTAASTLSLRSFEYRFMPEAYHRMDQHLR